MQLLRTKLRPTALAVLASVLLCVPLSANADVQSIELVKVVPGKQVEFMRWMAAWDEVYKEIGLAQPQWFRNIRGDKWDFVIIWPPFDAKKEADMEAVGKKKGLEIGFAWRIKYWSMVAESSSTLTQGPTTPAALLQSAGL
jgi:hypothetical protein